MTGIERSRHCAPLIALANFEARLVDRLAVRVRDLDSLPCRELVEGIVHGLHPQLTSRLDKGRDRVGTAIANQVRERVRTLQYLDRDVAPDTVGRGHEQL